MSESRLIELSYFDPKSSVRLTAYADTVVLENTGGDSTIIAIRFGGYPEMVRAMSDAIYGGGTIEAVRNDAKRLLKSRPKGYRRQLNHDGVYAAATLMADDDALTAARAMRRMKRKPEPSRRSSPGDVICSAPPETGAACLRSWITRPPPR